MCAIFNHDATIEMNHKHFVLLPLYLYSYVNSLSKILCSDFHLMSAFEKTRYIFDQSIWECNGHFDHWFSNIKSFLCDVWNLCKEKLYPEDFSMNTASNSSVERRVVNGRNAMAKRP